MSLDSQVLPNMWRLALHRSYCWWLFPSTYQTWCLCWELLSSIYAFFWTVGGAYKNAVPKTQFHCRTDRSGLVGGAPWISVPYTFQWGAPTFDAGEAFAMMAASFVALVESTGAYSFLSRYASATPCAPSVMSRGIGWQGVGILLDGLFGTANGSSVSVENACLLGLTRVGSRRVGNLERYLLQFRSNNCSYIVSSLCICRYGRSRVPSVLQPEQLRNKIHRGILCVYGFVGSTVFQ